VSCQATLYCSPSSQDGSEIADPTLGLCCYEAQAPQLRTPIIFPIEDEFGALSLQLKKSTTVCKPCTSTPLP